MFFFYFFFHTNTFLSESSPTPALCDFESFWRHNVQTYVGAFDSGWPSAVAGELGSPAYSFDPLDMWHVHDNFSSSLPISLPLTLLSETSSLFVFAVSVSIRYGYYGDNRITLGPSSSRMIKASSVFVQQVEVRDVDKKGVSLYALSEEPKLSQQVNWNVSNYLIIGAYNRKVSNEHCVLLFWYSYSIFQFPHCAFLPN